MRNNKKGFSVAEAMITMLIVSCALAAAAPLFTKRAKSSLSGPIIPSGAIMYFDRTTCPDGFSALVDKYPDSANSFLRNISGTDRTLGSKQLDAAPNITGSVNGEQAGTYASIPPTGAFYVTSGGLARGGDYAAWILHFDASRSSEVYGRDGATEVRPANVAFLACVKD